VGIEEERDDRALKTCTKTFVEVETGACNLAGGLGIEYSEALTELPTEQRDCLVMRFLQGMSISETAKVLGRSDGAVKQLQLRGVRNLARLMPEGIRD
jgi:RNA polymerase sigma-70 factor (ECF subfamily)